MNLTQQLTLEHHDVKIMLEIIMIIASNIEQNKELDTGHFSSVLDFLKIFVDKCHHGKEEQSLFPALEKAGISKTEGVFSFMMPEHEQGRGYVRELKEAFDEVKKGNRSALTKIAEISYFYVRLLRHHIDREDHSLFPLAEQVLSDEVKYTLYKEFEEIEERVTGPGVHEKYEELISSLSKIYRIE